MSRQKLCVGMVVCISWSGPCELLFLLCFIASWTTEVVSVIISCPLWSSVYECQRVECAFTSPVRTECGMFVMYCMQCCMSVSAVL